MKIIDQRKSKMSNSIESSDIPVGTCFSGQICDTISGIFLKTYNQIVLMDDPRKTWTDSSMIIYNYCPLNVHLVILD